MSRIGATLSGIERNLLNRLAEANAAATLSSLRMATGQKIRTAADDPAAFVRLSGLQAELSTVAATLSNITAATSLVTQAQSASAAIRAQLGIIRTELLKDEQHTLSADERLEAQAKIDEAIAQIDALACTRIGSRRLLDGSADFHLSGRNSSQAAEVRASSIPGSSGTISGSVVATATRAELTYTGAGGQTTAAAIFTLSGIRGDTVISVSSSESLAAVTDRINDQSHATGVTASTLGNTITLRSVDYGANATVAVDVSSGTFTVAGGNGDGTANGTNASAEINGHTIASDSPYVQGNRFMVSEPGWRFEVEFTAGFTGTINPVTVSGDALKFALSPDLNHRATLAIPAVSSAGLGGPSGTVAQLLSGGQLSGLSSHASQAIRVVDEALGELTRIDGAIDGFYNASLLSTADLMTDLQDNLQDAVNDINAVDDEEEYERESYYLGLASNSAAGLAILRQQRASVVALIQQIAGLI